MLPFLLDIPSVVMQGARLLGGHLTLSIIVPVYNEARLVREVLPFWHTLANRALTALSNTVTRLRVTDMETCYKVMRTAVVRALPLREERFGFEPEVTALLAHYGRRRSLRLAERRISYQPRSIKEGKKIRLKDAFRAVYCILRYGLVPPAGLLPAGALPAATAPELPEPLEEHIRRSA